MDWLYQTRPRTQSPTIVKQIRFRDVNPDFMLDNNDIVITEHAALRARMRHILSTVKGTELFEPEFGSLLPLRLYEPISVIMGYMLESDTVVALNRWMFGDVIIGTNTQIVPLMEEEGYRIELPYLDRATNTAATYTFDALR